MPAHQHTPWASGARKAPPSGRRKKRAGPVQQAKKKTKRFLDHHPLVSLVTAIACGLVSILCLVLGLVLENVLFYLAMVVAGLGAAASRRAMKLAQERKFGGDRIPKPPRAAARKPPAPAESASAAEPPPTVGKLIKCTRTGKPTGECDCSTRGHVASPEGLRRFGGVYGDPIGAKKKPKPAG